MGPRRRVGGPRREQGEGAAMEEGRDGPSEVNLVIEGIASRPVPQWRRAEMGPRRLHENVTSLGGVSAAMEEGRDGPSEAGVPHCSRCGSRTRRNGGGPRWALGGTANGKAELSGLQPQWRRAEMGPRRSQDHVRSWVM